MAVNFGVETSLSGTGLRAGELEDGGLGLAAAFVGEDVVETHGWCWGCWMRLCWWRVCSWLLGFWSGCGGSADEGMMRTTEWDVKVDINNS